MRDWTAAEREQLRRDVPRLGLAATVRGRTVQALAVEVLDLAAAGLARRHRFNESGRDEAIFLEPLRDIARSGRTAAEDMLEAYRGRWHGSVDPLFREFAY